MHRASTHLWWHTDTSSEASPNLSYAHVVVKDSCNCVFTLTFVSRIW